MEYDYHPRDVVEFAIGNSSLVVQFFCSPIYTEPVYTEVADYWMRSFLGTGFGFGWENVDGLLGRVAHR